MATGKWVAGLTAVILALTVSGAAMAQRNISGSSGNGGGSLSASNPYSTNANLSEAIKSMQAKNYVLAERKFREVLQEKPNEPRANFMLGVTEMQLGKWNEAKTSLSNAVRISPREPDPKSRLAVTLLKLGDAEGAAKQRAELAKMSEACKDKCTNAKWIAADIEMIDQAMAEPKLAPAL